MGWVAMGWGRRAGRRRRPGVRSRRETYQLIVRCLREVFKTACAEIVQGLYRESDIRWCVTIPAIWDSYTADLMYQAAVEAGLPSDPERLLLAREPAAAALHCLATGEDQLGENGTRFMLVDAGGGTVDIASYEVRSRGQLSQLVEPDGAKCGSEFLNDRFMELELSQEFGPDGWPGSSQSTASSCPCHGCLRGGEAVLAPARRRAAARARPAL